MISLRRSVAIEIAIAVWGVAGAGCFSGSDPVGPSTAAQGSAIQASVLQFHKNPSHDGLSIDPSVTRARVQALEARPSISVPVPGPVYAQPLYLENAISGRDLVYVATERNAVLAIDAASGAIVWRRNLGTPAPLSSLKCGNIGPLGVTGTPVIDAESKILYVDAMTTPDGGATHKHLIYALSAADGSVRSGFPVDVEATLAAQGIHFNAADQNQRGALQLMNGTVYVPYGGHLGDCGSYHGWVIGVPAHQRAPLLSWSTSAPKGGSWAPGGISSDGAVLYVTTGNTEGAASWAGGNAVIRLPPSLKFSGSPSDYFAPANWRFLDDNDLDLGSTGAVLVDLSGATPSRLVFTAGKDGNAFFLDRNRLGGIAQSVFSRRVASGIIITAPAAYPSPAGNFVVLWAAQPICPAGQSGELLALRLNAESPPSFQPAWCAAQNGHGSPMVTTTDGRSDPVVWSVGAEGDNRLHAFDGATGQPLFSSSALDTVRRFETPIEAKGKVFVVSDSALSVFRISGS